MLGQIDDFEVNTSLLPISKVGKNILESQSLLILILSKTKGTHLP